MERTSSSEANLVIDLNAKPMQPDHEEKEELNKMKWENKKLNELLTIICTNFHDLKKRESEQELYQASRKRKFYEIENFGGNIHSCCSTCDECRPREIKSNVSSVHVRIDPSDTTMVVKDGYQWRKYGQKVTRDNPSPRAYYKCSMAPACSVKKKVQRSANDPSLLVATYEGRHNHHPSGGEAQLAAEPPGVGGASSSPVWCSGCAAQNLDRTINNRIQTENSNSAIQHLIVEQMASSLTRNHSFTDALVAAITGRILDDVSEENEDSLSNSRVFSG